MIEVVARTMNEHLKRIAVGALVVGVVLLLIAARGRVPRPGFEAPRVARGDMQQLRHAIEVLKRTWNPVEREQVLADLRARREVIGPAVVEVIDDPRHRLRADAAQLAGDLCLVDARPSLVRTVWSESEDLLGVAVAAAEAIAPWTDVALEEILADGTRAQRLAVLALCANRDQRPTRAIESLLADADSEIRRAALGALPPTLSDLALGECITLAEHASLGPAARAVLARSQLTAAQSEFVGERSFAWSPATQLAVLAACQGGPSVEPLIWRLAISSDAEVRVRALELLDRRQCSDSERIRAVTFGLPAEGLYWAARCLVRGNDPAGVRLLLDLATSEAADAERARLMARMTLEELSRIPAAAGADAWRAWSSRLSGDLRGLKLSSTPVR